MTDRADIEKLLETHKRHLLHLQEQQAIYGVDTPPYVLMGIDDTRARIAALEAQLGGGAPPEAQSNLFTPFFSTKPHGQGIGLTLVQEILSAHGFDYGIERTAHGTTRFSIAMDTSTSGAGRDDLANLPTRQLAE